MLKKTICKLVVGVSFCLFLFCIGTTSVYAKDKVTSTIDLTSQESVDKLSDEGWSWDDSSKTLTLDGITVEITDSDDEAKDCIKFNKGDKITIIFKGENHLIADKGYSLSGVDTEGDDGTLTLKGEEDAVLNLGYKTFKSTHPGNNGTVSYMRNLVIESGTINSEGAIVVDDTFTMKGGNFNLESWDTDDPAVYVLQQVNIMGGNLHVASRGTAIMVPGELKETDEADGVVISGGNVFLDSTEWDAIRTAYPNSPEGNYIKNVVINGGNITLGGESGIYVRQGSIIVNRVDSWDVSNVKQDVFKIDDVEGNEIICPEADYSAVDEAIDKANALNKDDYQDFSAVTDAMNAVIRGKNLLEQKQVDAMAYNINNAIANLKLKYEPVDNPSTYDGILTYAMCFVLGVVGLEFSTYLYKKKVSIHY